MPKYIIREAKAEDSNLLYNLWVNLSFDHYKKQGKNLKNINAINEYDRLINEKNRLIFVAEADESIVGFIEAVVEGSTEFEGGKYIYILHCFIEKDYRNTKIIFDFLNRIEYKAVEFGLNTIFTDIYVKNRRFYNNIIKLDFVPFKTRFIKKI
jgi:GNAT superfamily N-acetyltransferase